MNEFSKEAGEALARGVDILLSAAEPEALAIAERWASAFFNEGFDAEQVSAIGARIMMGAAIHSTRLYAPQGGDPCQPPAK